MYVVWFSVLGGDRRAGWDPTALPDRRVTHVWDANRVIGPWFAQHIDAGGHGFVWDTYLLYGPEAHWEAAPGPLLSSGFTVIQKHAQLEQQLVPLLEPE